MSTAGSERETGGGVYKALGPAVPQHFGYWVSLPYAEAQFSTFHATLMDVYLDIEYTAARVLSRSAVTTQSEISLTDFDTTSLPTYALIL